MEKKLNIALLVVAVAFGQNGVCARSYVKTQLQHDAAVAGITSLVAAVIAGDYSKTKALCDGGTDINERRDKYTALMHSIRQGNLQITTLLNERKATINNDDIQKVIVESVDSPQRDACVKAVLDVNPGLVIKTGMGETNQQSSTEAVLARHKGQ